MTDPAAFREDDIRAVWKGQPRCVVTGLHGNVDLHHLIGRGPKKRPELRKVHSSVLNACPLIRAIHSGPMRDTPDFRSCLLKRVRQEVMQAIGQGRYTLTEIDEEFLKISDTYL